MGKDSEQTSRKAAPKIVNPYAKKTKSAKSAPAASAAAAAAGLKPVDIGASASFSQAFASVEDTTHFQQELDNLKQGSNPQLAQQRAFDTAAAAAPALSDRDHHALLQPHVLYVSTKQRGNGLLKHIRNVPFEYSKMTPDYIMNQSRCALFLSCKYHSLHPTYIHRRIAELKTDFILRVLLVLVDVEDNSNILLFLNNLAVVHNMTLILAWTEEEAARYLETFKAFDGKDASSIQRREQSQFGDQVADVLKSVGIVNKTDSAQLMTQFSTFRAVVAASMDELGLCDGMGEKKVKRLHDAFHKPFSSRAAKQRREGKQIAVASAKGEKDTTLADAGEEEMVADKDANSDAKVPASSTADEAKLDTSRALSATDEAKAGTRNN